MNKELNCEQCDTFKSTKGRGTKKCLKCQSYRSWQRSNTPRKKLSYQILPDEIVEDMPSGNPTKALEAIQALPDDLSAVMSMHYYGGLSVQSIAAQLHKSTATIKRMMTLGMSQAKKNINQLKQIDTKEK